MEGKRPGSTRHSTELSKHVSSCSFQCCVHVSFGCSQAHQECQDQTFTSIVILSSWCISNHHPTPHLTTTPSVDLYSVHHAAVHLGYAVTALRVFAVSAQHLPWSSLKSSCFSRPETDASVHTLARRKICSPCIALHQPNVVSFKLSI